MWCGASKGTDPSSVSAIGSSRLLRWARPPTRSWPSSRTFRAQHPISEGLPREEARARVFRGVDAGIFEAAMRRLVAARAIVDRDRLALPSHKAALPAERPQWRA